MAPGFNAGRGVLHLRHPWATSRGVPCPLYHPLFPPYYPPLFAPGFARPQTTLPNRHRVCPYPILPPLSRWHCVCTGLGRDTKYGRIRVASFQRHGISLSLPSTLVHLVLRAYASPHTPPHSTLSTTHCWLCNATFTRRIPLHTAYTTPIHPPRSSHTHRSHARTSHFAHVFPAVFHPPTPSSPLIAGIYLCILSGGVACRCFIIFTNDASVRWVLAVLTSLQLYFLFLVGRALWILRSCPEQHAVVYRCVCVNQLKKL